jgi:hypothetical protein
MRPFLRKIDGSLFKVDDVRLVNGRLVTKRGVNISEPINLPPRRPAPPPAHRPVNDFPDPVEIPLPSAASGAEVLFEVR